MRMRKRFGFDESAVLRSAALRSVAALYELWMLLPLFVLLLHLPFAARTVTVPWIAAYIALCALAAASSVWVRSLWLQLGATAVIAVAAAMAAGSAFGLGPVALAGGLLLGFTAAYRSRKIGWHWTGVASYFAGSILFAFMPKWADRTWLFTMGGLICLAVALFASNSLHLRAVTLSKRDAARIPLSIKRHNRLFVAVIFFGMLLLGAGLGKWLVHLAKQSIGAFLHWFLSLFGKGSSSAPIQEPPPSAATPPPLPEPGEPSKLAEWLEKIAIYAAIVIAAALIAYLIYRFVRSGGGRFRRWLDRLKTLLGRTSPEAAGVGFTDEETSLFSWEETKNRLKTGRLGKWFGGPSDVRWEQLTNNRERIRYLYRRWLRTLKQAGYVSFSHLTPRETLEDFERWSREKRTPVPEASAKERMLIEVYYDSRYGAKEPPDDAIAALRNREK